ncbi:MAG: hypothetical protein JWN84_2733 [Nocardioides sp.]|jgi:hypothetical protein|nr:hypothetical protein [Nocardioides sp.]
MRSLSRALLVPTVLVALATTSAGGVATSSAAPSADGSAARAQAGAWSATIKISRSVSDVNERITLSGRVAPARRGTVVKLQKRLAGKSWVAEATLRTTGTGAWSYNDTPGTAGKRSYRVVVPATSTRTKGTSPAVGLTLYRWQDLTTVAARAAQGTGVSTTVKINGTAYARGLSGYSYSDEGFVDWNFARRCTSLKARFGNGDNSADTATANVQLVVDGTPLYTESFGLTESAAKTFDVTSAFRVAFKWTSSNVTGTPEDQSGAQPVMVSPLVRCSF